MKRYLVIALSFLLGAVIAVGATFALLSDTDSDVNVMTLGNVKITQNEQQRVFKDGQFTSELENYKQGKALLPVTYDNNKTADEVTVGDYTLTLSDDENNYVDKIISVTNDGKTNAYVRTLVAIPTGGEAWEPNAVSANNCWLHWNIPAEYGTYWTLNSTPTLVDISGTGYYIWEFVHKDKVEAGKTTYPMVRGFYMDERVDNDDNGYFITYNDGVVKRIDDFDLGGSVDILVVSQAVQAEGFDDAQTALDAAFGDITVDNNPWIKDGSAAVEIVDADNAEELQSAIDNADKPTTIVLSKGNYTTNMKVGAGKDITIIGTKDTVLSGQIATTSSTEGTITIKGVTINVDSSISDSTGISQTGKSAIAIWGNQTVICEDVTFNMSLADSTAITSWWDTGIGTSIIVRNCTFNCNGQRPIRATGNVTVENCTFDDPYRYAVQLTAKASTATLMDKAIINFTGNTIVNGENGKDYVYGIQLEGADYGCHDCVINGSNNKIVDGGEDSTMYYCECGKVDHDTIEWNTEVDPVHEK